MLSSECFESKTTACGVGSVQELGCLTAYVTGSPHSNLSILFISDAFGYESQNLRKLADKVASAGYFVAVPDFLYGDPCDPNNPQFDRESWMRDHNTVKGFEDAKAVIAALKSKGVSAVGAAGFCWGGMVAVKLAGSDEITAAVVLHPGQITEDEINEVKVPIAILGAEFDHIFPAEKLEQFGQILSKKTELDSMVKIFPGVGHGWTVRYNVEDESAVTIAHEAHEDMLNWLLTYVK